ncbi:MAG: hypothetical protein NTX79_08275 [Candidatus Micrarchaeota archaeon]|nr:hypothetical protein [Candidatus Micrarchaeota archaeon]
MATKKAKRAMRKAAAESCECDSPMAGIPHIQDWLLILLGALGLGTALGYISWPGFASYFPVVWSVLVLVIGATNLMNKKCSC